MDTALTSQSPAIVEVKSAPKAEVAEPARDPATQPIEVSLTKFIDFILKNGRAKLTVVKEAKKQNETAYDPMTDFYRILREGVASWHQTGEDKKSLDKIMARIRNEVKLNTYPDFLSGYKKFLGRRTYEWFQPPKAAWRHGGLLVRVNPELGLQSDATRLALKMYLRSQGDLDKRRAVLITHVMQSVLAERHKGLTLCVLDVKNGRNYPAGPFDPSLSPVLRGEALSFVEMYRSL